MSKIVQITDQNFEEEVLGSDVPTEVDFWAPWCGPCQMMGPVFEELSDEYDKEIKFVKINTDENSDLASQFNISGIPCLILMENGKEKERIVGFMQKGALKEKINKIK